MEDTSHMEKRCQICYVTFDSIDALREHIWRYQVEVNWHSTRIQEAQLHLHPRQHRIPWSQPYRPICHHCTSWPHCENCSPQGDTGDEYDDDNNDNGRDDGEDDPTVPSWKGQTLRCPDPKCNKTFMRITRLLPHFGKHVQCFEICVFCRESFSEAFRFLGHKCQNLKHGTAREYYVMERHSQLRKYVIDKLYQMDPMLPKPQERKRPHEGAKFCSVMRLGKKRKASTDDDGKQALRESQSQDMAANSLDAISRMHPVEAGASFHNTMMMLPTPAPVLPRNIDSPDVDFATDSTLSLSMIGPFSFSTAQPEPYLSDPIMDHHPVNLFCVDGMPGLSTAQKVAPVFRNVTITPGYNTGHKPFDDAPPYSMAHEATKLSNTSTSEIMAGQVGNKEAGWTTESQKKSFC